MDGNYLRNEWIRRRVLFDVDLVGILLENGRVVPVDGADANDDDCICVQWRRPPIRRSYLHIAVPLPTYQDLFFVFFWGSKYTLGHNSLGFIPSLTRRRVGTDLRTWQSFQDWFQVQVQGSSFTNCKWAEENLRIPRDLIRS